MKPRSNVAALAASILSLVSFASRADTLSKLGEPLNPELEVVPIASILDDPDGWVGKTVQVEGTVDGVCAMKGCWMELVSGDDRPFRVKVDDGVIEFPAEAIGRRAVAEGTVELVEMTRDGYVSWLRHLADEQGSAFDPDSVGDGPYRIVQLRGLGAEIALP